MALLEGNKLRSVSAYGKEGTIGYMHWCPGCGGPHFIRTVNGGNNEPVWTFNGDVTRPTFGPSILCYHTTEGGGRKAVCHYFLREGRLEYCGDSPHQYAGQTIELPDWPKGE